MRYTTLLSDHIKAATFVTLTASALAALALSYAPARADPPETDPVRAVPLSPELQAALQDFLNYDPTNAPSKKPVSPLRKPPQNARTLDWNRTDRPDGSSAVSVKKPLPTTWDSKVGADFGLAPPPATTYQPDKPYGRDTGSGAAWATVTVPGVASVDARVDPLKEQRTFGTTVSRSVPLGSSYSVTVLNSFAVSEAPLTAQTPAQVWSNDRLVKFNVLSTGTSLAAGTTSSTVDNITRNKFSAEQKLFDKLNVTTAVTDVGSGRTPNKSITAGFKLQW